jgi:hypothetical protein
LNKYKVQNQIKAKSTLHDIDKDFGALEAASFSLSLSLSACKLTPPSSILREDKLT